jgi:hypothetical protein
MTNLSRGFAVPVLALALYDLVWWGFIETSIVTMQGGFVHAFVLPLILPRIVVLGLVAFFSREIAESVVGVSVGSILVFANGLVTGCTMFLAEFERCT